MARLIGERLLWGIITLWIASVLVFAGTELLSGDAATAVLGQTATPAALADVREALQLDRPAPERYASWFWNVLHGDLGRSLTVSFGSGDSATSVWELINQRLVNSALLAGLAALVTIPLGLFLGVLASLRPGRLVDSLISVGTLSVIAIPEFVTATVLILIFAIIWPILPAVSIVGGLTGLGTRAEALVLPVATLALASIGHTARMVRGSMIEVLESEYVRMARLKGVPERSVIFHHAFRNALVPTIQVAALTIAWLAGGIVVVEVVFDYPGIGQGLAQAVSVRDIPVVQALALFIAATYVVLNLIADVLTILLTPRLRQGQ
jgi:peptide/nickel transport system permease protein